ncbi:hypothetical protein JTB14_020594 [Gonioctena quinquepunctata]|nr:hypothetical protein JTB14_020594 [Gonioctena quinquepunctata]
MSGDVDVDPANVDEALSGPEKEQWRQAMEEEYQSFMDNEAWEITEVPDGANVVDCKWVYKKKKNIDGSVSKFCIGTADSTPKVKVGTIETLGIEENGPVESHTLASGLVCKPTGDIRIDLSLSNRSEEFNIASISDNSPKEQTDNQEIAAADDKGRRNAVPSAGKGINMEGPSLVRSQIQVYIPPFHGCDFDVPVDIWNSTGVKVCEFLKLAPGLCVAHSVVTIPNHNQNHSKPSIVVRICNKHTPILTLADVPASEGQVIPVHKNTMEKLNLQHMETSEKEVIQQFLHTYKDIFAETGNPLEASKIAKHRIDIGDSAPVYKPPYRVLFQQQPVVRQHINEMLQEGVIPLLHLLSVLQWF